MPDLAAVYRRVSTNQQDSGLQTQESELDRYVAYKEFDVTERTTFADEDTSGSIAILDRPGGARLFNTLKASPAIRHLVVAKLDRLGRNAQDLLQTFEALDRIGVTLHIVNVGGDNLSSQGPAGRMMLQILAVMAEFERALIRERIQGTVNRKFQAGEFLGGGVDKGHRCAPYGYDLPPDGETALLDNPVEQAVIRRMAHWRAGGLAYNAIAKELNLLGILSKTGRPWQSGNVAGVLQSKHTARLLAETDALQAA